MIIWLASYPKSGNTWLRVIISNIINSDKKDFDKPFNFMKQIDGYPNKHHFSSLVKDVNDVNEIVPNWINSQNLINLKKNITIFKTHNMLGSFGRHKFTDADNTVGVIYIVRDPRNVVSSIKNHFSLDSINRAKDFLLDKNKWIFDTEKKGILPSFISSWNMHYLSWKSFPKNYLLIKYEDLLKEPMNEVLKVYNYLKNFFDLNLGNEDLDKIINLSSFENLKRKENEGKFTEGLDHLKTKKKIDFFNTGPSNDWKKQLDEKLINELEEEFSKEMIELGYI